MALPEGYLDWIGRGQKHTVDGKELEAYPLTIDEYLEYISMRPDSTIEGEGDDRRVVYASKADEVKELLTIAYVYWATLRKQMDNLGSFNEWKANNPGFKIMGEAGTFVNEVIMATINPIQKKN